jgi:proline iminopeptidase
MLTHGTRGGQAMDRPGFDELRPASARLLDLVWRDRLLGAAIGATVAGASGLLAALVMPRGPVTAAQALALMATGLVVGIVAGFVCRSRWAMVLAPIAHIAVFEIGRLDADGPTVDGLRFDSTFGILAFLLGRGFYALVGLLPMMLGVTYGAALARRSSSDPTRPRARRFGRSLRRASGGLTTAGVIGLAVLIAWPAGTPPVRGATGEPSPNGIASLEKVRLGGHDQWIELRGASVDNPVLLYLSGGPGQSDLAFPRVFFDDLAHDFIVVAWDQRGTGKSYPSLDPETLTLDQAVSDTIELTNWLRRRFDEERIYLLGESWGSTLGVLAVQRQPKLYYAYIGSGQMVSQRETDRRIYHDLLAYAERTGDADLARTMRDYGEPPYDDVFAYGFVMTHYDKLAGDYDPPEAYADRGEDSGVGPWGLLASEYGLVDKINVLRGLIDMFAVMYPQLQEIDFRHDVPRLDVPVYILSGEYELSARRDLAVEWFDLLQAPSKRFITFENTGHAPAFEGFQDFTRLMIETVLPETYPGARSTP